MHFAESQVGEGGLGLTFQDDFPKTTTCAYCNGESLIAFVIAENGGLGTRTDQQRIDNPLLVCDLAVTYKGRWAHDCAAFATYLCPNCMKATTLWNQA
jgi:hypothetical protein